MSVCPLITDVCSLWYNEENMNKIAPVRLLMTMLYFMLFGQVVAQNMEDRPAPLPQMEARKGALCAETTTKLIATFSNEIATLSGQSISDCRVKANDVICDAERRMEEYRRQILKTITNDVDSLSRRSIDNKLAFIDRHVDALYKSATDMSDKCDKWLTIMTLVIAVLGVGMPLWTWFMDRKRDKNFNEIKERFGEIKQRSDQDAQQLADAISNHKNLVDQIFAMKREVNCLRIRNVIDQASARFAIFRSYVGLGGLGNYNGEDFRLAIADVSHAIVESMQLCEDDKNNKELFSSAVTCLHNIICGYKAMNQNARKCGHDAMDKFEWKFDQKKLEECWTTVGLDVDKGNTLLPSIGAFIEDIC